MSCEIINFLSTKKKKKTIQNRNMNRKYVDACVLQQEKGLEPVGGMPHTTKKIARHCYSDLHSIDPAKDLVI